MIAQHRDADELAVQDAVSELQALVRLHYPDAEFEAFPNDDPEGIYLRIVVDIDDPSDVIEAILPRLADMQTDGLPIYPVAVRPLDRIVADADGRPRPEPTGDGTSTR